MKITVFTSTFNRAYILDKLYGSLERQSFGDFEWLVVDDGSDDNTGGLIRGWMKENHKFPIRYIYHENSGKCAAINRGLEMARGELFFVVDSDDTLREDALEKIVQWESELPKEEKYCAIAGNMENLETGMQKQTVLEPYYDGDLLDRYRGIEGERAIAFYTDVHRKYKYPVFEKENFMTEAVAWNRMAHDGYKARFYHEVICDFAFQDGGLTKEGHRIFIRNPRGYGLWLKEKDRYLEKGIIETLRLWYIYYNEMSFCEEEYRLTKGQIAEYIGAPLSMIYVISLIQRLSAKVRKGM